MKLKPLNEILPELIEGFVDDYEKGYIDRDDLIDGLATHIELEVKRRVESLLNEIENLKIKTPRVAGVVYLQALLDVKDLVKKHLKGWLKNDV